MPLILLVGLGGAVLAPLNAAAEGDKTATRPTRPLTYLDLRLDAALYVGGLHAGTLSFRARLKNGRYQASAFSRSLGIANYIVKWRGTISTKGIVSHGVLRPTYHTRNDKSRWGKRSVILDYGDGQQAPKVTLKEEGGKDPYRKRDKVPPAKTINTYDHLSGILAGVLRAVLSGQPACGAAIPFYDGKRRFDITLTPMGREQLKRSRYSAYHGPALKCRMKITRIAGFSHKWIKEKKAALASGSKEDEIFIWLARFKNGQIELPVKIEAANFLGVALMHPTRIDIDAKTRIALER